MSISPIRSNWPWLVLIAAMVVLFYFPVLFQQQTQIHAEGVSLGVALIHMLSTALKGDEGLLWTTSIYGGHPVFAEGQGGFANPLHLFLAWLLPPVQAYNLNQFLSMLLGGLGAFGMCRAARCGRAASAFASLALAFSPLWIGGVNNLAVGSTVAWVPWVLWAMMRWLQRADLNSACFFGAAVALMVLSGYPQLVHGVLIYMTVYLAVQLLMGPARAALWSRRTALLTSLGVAILFSIALSAVQWLPLLELAQESHRSGGISIIPQDSSTTTALLRGFLFTFSGLGNYPDISAGSGSVYFAGAGSLIVCLIISGLIFLRRTAVINGHLLATLLLFILGMGFEGTPIFKVLYDLHLVPGLHSFRVSFTYLFIALAGFVLLAAFSLDGLSGLVRTFGVSDHKRPLQTGTRWKLLLLLWMAFWLTSLWLLHVDSIFAGQYLIAAAWVGLAVGLFLLGFQRFLPAVAVLLLCVEIILFRIDSYDFGASSLISKPASVRLLEREANLRDYKFADRAYAKTYSLLHPKSPDVAAGLKKMLSSVTPAANALWGVSSLSGNLALGLQRRTLADPIIDEELAPGGRKKPGYRLIDFASVRYFTVGQYFALPGFKDVYNEADMSVRIVENPHARPRFQAFHNAVFVHSLEQAVEAVAALDGETLILEHSGMAPAPQSATAEGTQTWRLIEDRSDRYLMEIQASGTFWLFLADTNYPGWNAYLDGEPTQVYSAQLLGKAVLVPAGAHRLRLEFEPWSFRLGLAVTVLGSASMLLSLAWCYIRRKNAVSGTGI